MNMPSEKFKKTFSIKTDGKTDSDFTVVLGDIRLSVLTSRLLRVETAKGGRFTDEPTQAVLFRNIAKPEFKFTKKGNLAVISTADCVFSYNIKAKKMESITINGGDVVTDFKSGNLKGTYRTLDMANGAVKLEDGIVSRNGVAVVDDSKTVLICQDGTIKERPKCTDLYYFAYGHDYRGCIQDFYKLCGEVPLVPRYALGNWWSRYRAYTQQEYLSLMKNFVDREIPITVATIDMDWHWVDVVERFGKEDATYQRKPGKPLNNVLELFQSQGWTGYSWNTELFPDYKAMLKSLQNDGFKVTLNLHPAQGVRPYEDMYPQMCEALGMNPKEKKHIKFDITDPKYIEAYFDVLHKPYEKDGVDFWWIDWQQEKTTKVKGLDPLWALNHYHTLAFNGENVRPLILSRFAKVGSHRYPLGFSGDTIITWKSLDFQPYFTLTASNVGYTWWSHDIGGHHMGGKDDELYTRWVQFGMYSPINRLHSTNDEFMGKEPWRFSYSANSIATKVLRERHSMIPYIYSMNRRTNKDGIALCEPMYYTYPESEQAYEVKNQYFFGSELIVAPITSPMSKTTNLACVKVWLPKGRWTDIYNGYIYDGGKYVTMYRGIESIPVLAKEGAIIPLSQNDRTNDSTNPDKLTLRIFRGTNSFTLYEDDGLTMNYQNGAYAETVFKIRETGTDVSFKISKASGDLSVIPENRDYTLVFEDITDAKEIAVSAKYETKKLFDKLYITIKDVLPTQEITVELKGVTVRENEDKKELAVKAISRFQMKTNVKRMVYTGFIKDMTKPFPSNDSDLKGPIDEILALK